MMSLQSWWFLKTDRDDYKNTRVTQVERCYAGWNKSWGGWYRAWNATSEPVKETDQSCLKKTFPRTILFLGKDLFWGAKKRGSTGEVDACCSPQPPEALEDPDV